MGRRRREEGKGVGWERGKEGGAKGERERRRGGERVSKWVGGREGGRVGRWD